MAISKKESVKRISLRDFKGYSDATPSQKREIKREVGNFLVDQINQYLDSSNTPVKKGKYKKLKKDKTRSQLFEEGDMRSQITFSEYRDGIDVGIFSSAPQVERLKAFNHNVGDTLPQRQFIPGKAETFKRPIETGIKRVITKVIEGIDDGEG